MSRPPRPLRIGLERFRTGFPDECQTPVVARKPSALNEQVLKNGAWERENVRWLLPEASEGSALSLSHALQLHPLSARVLVGRGYDTPDAAARFLSDKLADLPDPMTMKGMPQTVDRLCRALREKQKITLYGDYDVDGVCSTALLSLFLEDVGGQVATYIPHRLEEGYGLNVQALERIAADGTRLLVTLDCGITSHAEISRGNALGLEAVVVDHHSVPDTMPPAVAVLNPLQPGCGYPTRQLCAAGVTFNLCMGLRKRLRDEGFFQGRKEPNLKAMMDLVALATVADVVPLTGANRILVKHGLAELSTARRPGIRALKEVSGMMADASVTAGQVGFKLGPRINAAGRMDDASLGLRLLRAKTEVEARSLAATLDAANRERQLIEQEILTAAMGQARLRAPRARGLVLHAEGWHAGVIGIVASRVVERYCRPTVVVALKDGLGKGSARSTLESFHLFDALTACAPHLLRFGGHKHAAGLTVEAGRVDAFRSAFEKLALAQVSEEDLIPRCRVDAMVRLDELTEEAVEAVQGLGPFGMGNPEPVFASRRLEGEPRVLPNKKALGEPGHLKLRFRGAPHVDAIGFGMADRLTLTEGPLDLAFKVEFDDWSGVRRLSLKLKDVRASTLH